MEVPWETACAGQLLQGPEGERALAAVLAPACALVHAGQGAEGQLADAALVLVARIAKALPAPTTHHEST